MSNRPTHKVVLTSKTNKNQKSTVGVAFVTKTPGKPDLISLVLNPGVVLDWRMADQFWINIYPDEAPTSVAAPPGPPLPTTGPRLPTSSRSSKPVVRDAFSDGSPIGNPPDNVDDEDGRREDWDDEDIPF